MIIEAAEGEGDGRNLLFTYVPREREFAITGFLVNRIPIELA
jgi:hypothetical protein